MAMFQSNRLRYDHVYELPTQDGNFLPSFLSKRWVSPDSSLPPFWLLSSIISWEDWCIPRHENDEMDVKIHETSGRPWKVHFGHQGQRPPQASSSQREVGRR